MNRACTEISNHTQERPTTSYNYVEYEDNSATYDKNILDKIRPYYDMQTVIQQLDRGLEEIFEVADGAQKLNKVASAEEQNTNTATFSPQPVDLEAQKSLIENYGDVAQNINDFQTELNSQYDKSTSVTTSEHPKYAEEWEKFYTARCEEISKTGIDSKNYDFMPQCTTVWSDRLNEFPLQEFATIEQNLSGEHGLSPEALDKENSDDDVQIIEEEQGFIDLRDISDQDSDVEDPAAKKAKFESPVVASNSTVLLKLQKYNEVERMLIAIKIAHKLLKENKEISSPEELEGLVNAFVMSRDIVSDLTESSPDEDDEDLSAKLLNDDFKILYESFDSLSSSQQEKFIEVLRKMKIEDPTRFQILSDQLALVNDNF